MKKLLLPLFFVCAVFASAAEAAKPQEQLLVLRIEKGKSATVTLRENVTTGFQWMAKYDAKLCKVEITHRGPEKTGDVPLCGAPGHAVITVRLLTDAPVDLTLEYRRPWEKDAPPAKILYYAVVPETNPSLFRPSKR